MSAFDKIATKTKPAAKKASTHPQATTTKEVRAAVDAVIKAKADLAAIKAKLADAEQAVIDAVLPQYLERGHKGQFTKSLEVFGDEGRLLFSTADAWSVPQDEDTLNQIRELIKEKYDEFISSVRSISIHKNVLSNEKTLDKIAKACEKAGLPVGDIFDVVDKVTAVDGLDQKQFELDEDVLEMFRVLVKQRKPALK